MHTKTSPPPPGTQGLPGSPHLCPGWVPVRVAVFRDMPGHGFLWSRYCVTEEGFASYKNHPTPPGHARPPGQCHPKHWVGAVWGRGLPGHTWSWFFCGHETLSQKRVSMHTKTTPPLPGTQGLPGSTHPGPAGSPCRGHGFPGPTWAWVWGCDETLSRKRG